MRCVTSSWSTRSSLSPWSRLAAIAAAASIYAGTTTTTTMAAAAAAVPNESGGGAGVTGGNARPLSTADEEAAAAVGGAVEASRRSGKRRGLLAGDVGDVVRLTATVAADEDEYEYEDEEDDDEDDEHDEWQHLEADVASVRRDYRHHHGHVRSLQLLEDDCTGIPSRFQESIYITLDDVEGKMDEAYEFELFNQELQYTLNECASKCASVENIDVLAQFFFEDRKRRRRNGRTWRRRAIIKAWAKGICYQCNSGQDPDLVADSFMVRARKLGRAPETGERRLQDACAELLKNRLLRHNIEAFECLTIAELSLVDPRCEMEAYLDELVEYRHLAAANTQPHVSQDYQHDDHTDDRP